LTNRDLVANVSQCLVYDTVECRLEKGKVN